MIFEVLQRVCESSICTLYKPSSVMLYPICHMEGEQRPPESEQEAEKAEAKKIIDSLPDDIRKNPELLAEVKEEALREYQRNAAKLASLTRELNFPANINWFTSYGNDLYEHKQKEAGVEQQFTKLPPPY